MALVRRGNVELEVADEFLGKYLAQGFNQIDNTGKIIGDGVPNNYTDLKRQYDALKVKYTALEANYNALLAKEKAEKPIEEKATANETKKKATKK